MAQTTRLTLPDGCRISLETLSQCHTYLGLLEGYPTVSMNQALIRSEMEKQRKQTGSEPYWCLPGKPSEVSRCRLLRLGVRRSRCRKSSVSGTGVR